MVPDPRNSPGRKSAARRTSTITIKSTIRRRANKRLQQQLRLLRRLQTNPTTPQWPNNLSTIIHPPIMTPTASRTKRHPKRNAPLQSTPAASSIPPLTWIPSSSPAACPPAISLPKSHTNSPPCPRSTSRRIYVTWKPIGMPVMGTISSYSCSRIKNWYGAGTSARLRLFRVPMAGAWWRLPRRRRPPTPGLSPPSAAVQLLPGRVPSRCPSKSIRRKRSVYPSYARRFISRNSNERSSRPSTSPFGRITCTSLSWCGRLGRTSWDGGSCCRRS
mmetsp:Transcript_212/g.423  ORF Transcript_212/g.423 Transcript_212/m.423 type:complete len:274 (+) Transcript_212:346-1167(+)